VVEGFNPHLALRRPSAQAIRWDAWATPIWVDSGSPHILPHRDHNRVNGTIGAGAGGAVLRGAAPTQVELSMIPANYKDKLKGGTKAQSRAGFRLQFASAVLGDTQTFSSRAAVYNGSALRPRDFLDESTAAYAEYYDGSLRENFIVDDGFVAEGVSNQVAFELTLAQADVMLAVTIDKKTTASEVLGTLGGLFPIIASLICLVMVRYDDVPPHGNIITVIFCRAS